MLSAYYDCTCDSDKLFCNFDIAKTDQYRTYLNSFNVIYLDITGFISDLRSNNKDLTGITGMIKNAISSELIGLYPEIKNASKMSDMILKFVGLSGKKFVFIIDEWDAIIREGKNNPEVQEA